MRRARMFADLLTICRLGIAVAVIPSVWAMSLGLTATLLTVAWLTDVFDGRIVRAAGIEGRMGRWDMSADTAVGAGVVIGLVGAGHLPAGLGLISVVGLGAWFSIWNNHAAAMLLQLTGFIPVLALLWSDRPFGWWLPFATMLGIGVVDWRRLVAVNIPNFIRGVAGRRPAGP